MTSPVLPRPTGVPARRFRHSLTKSRHCGFITLATRNDDHDMILMGRTTRDSCANGQGDRCGRCKSRKPLCRPRNPLYICSMTPGARLKVNKFLLIVCLLITRSVDTTDEFRQTWTTRRNPSTYTVSYRGPLCGSDGLSRECRCLVLQTHHCVETQ